jgi:hypothetical protein
MQASGFLAGIFDLPFAMHFVLSCVIPLHNFIPCPFQSAALPFSARHIALKRRSRQTQRLRLAQAAFAGAFHSMSPMFGCLHV